jgi:toxin ParE1/3/4
MAINKRPAAEADLLAIWQYVAADNDVAADRLLDRIETALRLLEATPRAGRARPELGPGVRSFVVGRYMLFYGIEGDGLDLYRVLHGARDIGAAFAED